MCSSLDLYFTPSDFSVSTSNTFVEPKFEVTDGINTRVLKIQRNAFCTGYSLVYNAWLTLIFEALESVSTSLSFTAAVTYAAKLSSISTDTSIQGLLGGVYYGVGTFVDTFIRSLSLSSGNK